jgi:hypothetical protein
MSFRRFVGFNFIFISNQRKVSVADESTARRQRATMRVKKVKVKVKQYRYRPGVAQRVPGSYGSQIT